MFKIKLPTLDVTISISSISPDNSAPIKFEGDAKGFVKELASMYGMYGHRIGRLSTPLDLNAAIVKSGLDYEIIEGAEILEMPQEEIPAGAKW